MKILHIVQGFYPANRFGGTPQVVFNVCSELVKSGHKVSVWATNALDKKTRMSESTIQNVMEAMICEL